MNFKDCSIVDTLIKMAGYILFLAVFCLKSDTFADIAPAQYKGWTLSPKFESRIRMKNEEVDISWGDVCEVKAIFNLENESDSIISLKIGFPVTMNFQVMTHFSMS